MRRKLTTVLVIAMLFSMAVVFLSACGQKNEEITSLDQQNKPQYSSLEDFRDKRIGVLTGTIQGAAVEKEFPDSALCRLVTISTSREKRRGTSPPEMDLGLTTSPNLVLLTSL